VANYTVAEDILRCNTWKAVNTDQVRHTYWPRMKECFDTHNTSGINRTDKSLRSYWSTIMIYCQKWAACIVMFDCPSWSYVHSSMQFLRR
jgi:hypothetical protein